ncbi:hypothetical protein ESCOCP327B2_16670 [Escherichia coli]
MLTILYHQPLPHILQLIYLRTLTRLIFITAQWMVSVMIQFHYVHQANQIISQVDYVVWGKQSI